MLSLSASARTASCAFTRSINPAARRCRCGFRSRMSSSAEAANRAYRLRDAPVPRLVERRLQRRQRRLLAGAAVGREGARAACRIDPARGDRHHLLMQARGVPPVHGEPPEQHHPGIASGGRGETRLGQVVMDQPLGGEAAEQALGDAVLQVQMHGLVAEPSGVLERDGPDARPPAPRLGALAAPPALAQRIEGGGPAGVADQDPVGRELERGRRAMRHVVFGLRSAVDEVAGEAGGTGGDGRLEAVDDGRRAVAASWRSGPGVFGFRFAVDEVAGEASGIGGNGRLEAIDDGRWAVAASWRSGPGINGDRAIMHGQDAALATPGKLPDPSRDAGQPEADRQRPPELRRGQPDVAPRPFQPAFQNPDGLPQTVPAGAHVLELLLHGLSPVVRRGTLDAVRELGQPVAAHALPTHGFGHPAFEHRGGAAELGADALRLLHEHLEYPILGALAVEEVAAEHLAGGLELAVDAAVALVETARVPGQVEVEQIGAVALQVQSLAGGVGGDQDA